METTETSNFDSYNQHQEKPNNNMVLAIISMIMGCCSPCLLPGLILGIIAVVNANKVNSSFDAGDIQGAEKAAKNAKTFSYIALGLGVLGILINIGTMVFAPEMQQEQMEKIQEMMEQMQQGQ